jgi:hypothetical protein
VSIYLSRIGPGIFFALFGSAILVYALRPVEFDHQQTVAAAASSPGAPPAAMQTVHHSGIGSASSPDLDQRQAERNNAVGTVFELKKIEDAVELALKGRAQEDAKAALEDAKVRIMRTVWDEEAWGPLGDFEAWRTAGMPQPAPKGIARAAAVISRAPK